MKEKFKDTKGVINHKQKIEGQTLQWSIEKGQILMNGIRTHNLSGDMHRLPDHDGSSIWTSDKISFIFVVYMFYSYI